jgi:amino acid adenylation domain-containing protein
MSLVSVPGPGPGSPSAPDLVRPTLVELLRARAEREPTLRGYTFLLDGEAREAHLDYAALDHQARAIAATLQELGAQGQRALLLYPPGLEYIAGFFGCLYAGVVAVPIYPPDMGRLGRTLPRLLAVASDAQATVALTTSAIHSMASMLFQQVPELAALRWVATDAVDAEAAASWRDPDARPETLVFLQYTSGSTAAPKGVMLTHANLLHNLGLIYRCFGHSRASQGVIWLPPYHDMGLIGGILQPLYGGFPVTLLSPVDFLKKPLRWLQAVSRYRATTSGGPNFAYDLCVRKTTPAERAALDLGSWDLAFNGAEPIHPETLDRFMEAFGPAGFRREAFYSCYGLAEATLIASGGEKAALPALRTVSTAALKQNRAEALEPTHPEARTLVGAGRTLAEQRLVIVQPDTGEPCPTGRVGEIWVAGPSVAQGYWDRPEDTARAFQAMLAGDAPGTRFLRTGDLGFLDETGELYVTGRIKDLIIIRGRNHYPQDLERTVELCHPALRPGCGAAFSVDVEGEERLVVVQEVERRAVEDGSVSLADLGEAIRQTIADQHELMTHEVVLLRGGSIPKTSSGKIQRHACRSEFLAGSLEALHRSQVQAPAAPQSTAAPVPGASETSGETAQRRAPAPAPVNVRLALAALQDPEARKALLVLHLQEAAAQVLRLAPSQIDPRRSLYAFGLDSLMAVELKAAVEASLGVEVPLGEVLEGAELDKVAAGLLMRMAGPPGAHRAQAAVGAAGPEETGDAPLSGGQQALWFLHQLAPESAAYHVPVAVRVRARLDIPALRRTFMKLVERHPALRTTFAVTPAGPVQRVHAELPLDFEAHGVEDMGAARVHEVLSAEAGRPFDLERGPLLRVRVLTRGPDDHFLLLVLHHIVTDFWSLALLAEDIDALYPAEVAGRPVTTTLTLPRPERTYADYARWQAEMLAGPRGAALLGYWQGALGGELPVLNLPTDISRPRPPVQTYNGRVHTARIGARLTEALKALAQRHGCPLGTVLQAAFQVLLHRYSGQRDLLLGIVGAGRSRAELGRVVGYCVNPLVIRTRPAPAASFAAYLGETRERVAAALEHQDYPFNALVDRLQPVRDYSRSPLFQVMFVYQRAPRLDERGLTALGLDLSGARAELAGLAIESVALEHTAAQFDLTLTMGEVRGEAAGELVASFEYNTDLFRAETVARMAAHFETLLASISEERGAEQRLGELALLTAAEREQLRTSGTGAEVALPAPNLSAWFAAQVERTPAQVAVRFQDAALDYRTLAERVERLGVWLSGRGIGRGAVIGLCLERSLETVIAVLGVLRAGAAYVPLDPAYPAERLGFILADARVPFLLTHGRLKPQLESQLRAVGATAEVVCLDTDFDRAQAPASSVGHPTPPALPPLPPFNDIAPHDLACLIYTSGSTGQPKGVMLEHVGLVNLVHSFIRSYGATTEDRMLPLTSIASASFVGEILPLLCVGGTLVLPTEDQILDLEALVGLITRHGVTIASTVPAVIKALNARAAQAQGGDLGPLRFLLSGGEALGASDVEHLLGKVTVVNGYGLTETTVCATYYPLAPQDLAAQGWVPIGRPIPNTTVYVLDAEQRVLPEGCPGELCVGGLGLARGYWNRPELTAERFVPDPFRPGERMYRTGDLARRLEGGVLEYLHRVDDQIKIRGFRIELGEIEAALRRHPDIRDVFVTAREDTPGERRLVAYVVAAGTLTTGALHPWLSEHLPPYMVPSAFVLLPALPLTAHGKVDTRALPAPDGHRTSLGLGLGAAYTPPQSELERRVAAVWQEVLKLDQVGIHDNFFELGGNSLLLAQAHRRLREALQADLALVDLFKYTTVSALAKHLGAKQGAAEKAPATHQRIQDEAHKRKEALARRQQAAKTRGRPGR